MDFLHLFVLFLLLEDENDYEKWQEESLLNEELVAQFGLMDNLQLIKEGHKVSMEKWIHEIYDQLEKINNQLELSFDEVLSNIKEKLDNPKNLYSRKLLDLVKSDGYINTQVKIAKNNKKESITRFNAGYYDKKGYGMIHENY
jgi:glutamate--cysteine ligase